MCGGADDRLPVDVAAMHEVQGGNQAAIGNLWRDHVWHAALEHMGPEMLEKMRPQDSCAQPVQSLGHCLSETDLHRLLPDRVRRKRTCQLVQGQQTSQTQHPAIHPKQRKRHGLRILSYVSRSMKLALDASTRAKSLPISSIS